MKYILIFFLVSTTALFIPNLLKPTTYNSVNTNTDSVKTPKDSVFSTTWFDTTLNIFIPQESITFNPTEYKFSLTKGMKDTLAYEFWLGSFTIVDMAAENGYTLVNFSKDEHKKIMFITPKFFVLTSYMKPNKETGLTYGSSIIYFPQKNKLKEMETFIVFGVYGDTLDGALEHYDIGEKEYVEYGQINVNDGVFIKAE